LIAAESFDAVSLEYRQFVQYDRKDNHAEKCERIGRAVACAWVVAADCFSCSTKAWSRCHAAADSAGEHDPVEFEGITANEESNDHGDEADNQTDCSQRDAGACQGNDCAIAVVQANDGQEEGQTKFTDNAEDHAVHSEGQRADLTNIAQNKGCNQNAAGGFQTYIS